ncbi:PA2169 family four-helix-bundle protein [Hyphomonas johnsonii]|uniref:DUF2383 domain-containing protein n=1 Tax=Hyphomonas johnsonii MHS-2 TaxID=1280950 RepID=A0A059FM25_9PROT|nr:PA2169 family four-helix-bundle protein [Hyphomonas johnsonii]KCZ91709.1 hypothetical protein HJO_11347 [Hyphomonas johnsonii MHS-2]
MRLHIYALTAIAAPLALGACANAGLSQQEQAAASQSAAEAPYLKAEVTALNKLAAIYIDAAALYKQAADIPDENNGLKEMLLSLHDYRNGEREVIQDRVIALGGQPATMGEALGTGHRTFTALRTAVDNDSEVAVEEVLRGEEYIRDELAKVAAKDLTPETSALIAKLQVSVKAEITKLKATDQAI